MTVIESKAQLVAENIEPTVGKAVAFDPQIILILIQVIQAIVKMIQECQDQNPTMAHPSLDLLAKSPGVIGRFRVRRAVREAIADDEMHGLAGASITRAIFNVGANVTTEEATTILEEAAAANVAA